MWITKYRVHCGRIKNDWLAWHRSFNTFVGNNKKIDATKFVSEKQARGAITKHRNRFDIFKNLKYTIHPVKVNVKREN